VQPEKFNTNEKSRYLEKPYKCKETNMFPA